MYTKSASKNAKTVYVVQLQKWFKRADLLATIRGGASQAAISRSMGFNFNKVYRWETGGIRMRWQDFHRFCSSCGIDLKSHLKFVAGTNCHPARFDLLLRQLGGHAKPDALVKATGLKAHRLKKLLSGNAEPNLEEAFYILETLAGAGKALYLAVISGRKSTESEELKKAEMRLSLAAAHPVSTAISVFLYSNAYRKLRRHLPGLIGKKLGISEDLESKLLKKLSTTNEIFWKDGKYHINLDNSREKTSPPSFAGHAKILTYWLREATQVLNRMSDYDSSALIGGYRIICVDDKTYAKIEDRFCEFYNEIGTIIRAAPANSAGTKFRVLSTQMFDPTSGR